MARFLRRFGGLVFFVLALVVVGVLVYMTVKSAQDNKEVTQNNDSSLSDSSEQRSNQADEAAVDMNPGASGQTNEDNNINGDSSGLNTDNEAENTAAPEQQNEDEDLPNTGPVTDIASVIAIMALTYFAVKYYDSKKALRSASLED